MKDLTLALRRLRKRPIRGLLAALTLSIGIGATTAAFAAVDTVLLRDLPVLRQDELVVAWRLNPERPSLRLPFRTGEYEFLAEAQQSLSAISGFTAWGALPVLVEGPSEEYTLDEVRVAGDFFGVAGARPSVGRLLEESDDDPGADPVAVLSHSAWRTQYGADPEILGTVLRMRGRAVTIVGVAPRRFDFPQGTDLWTPLRGEPYELHVLGRMSGGVDHGDVVSDIASAFEAGEDQGAAVLAGLDPVVVGLEEQVIGPVKPVLRSAFVAALALLLVGAANATLFLLTGGRTTALDVAVRRALGAKRGDVLTRVLADSGLVCALGTAAGLLSAWLAVETLAPLVPPDLPQLASVTMRSNAVLFAIAAGVLSALGTSVTVAGVQARSGLRRLLIAGGRPPSVGADRFRRWVAVAQVALTVVSAVGAGLLARTVLAMNRIDPGISAEDMTVIDLRVPYGWGQVPESYFATLEAVVRDLESQPGVVSARPTLGPPLQQRLEVSVAAQGQNEEEATENPYVAIDAVLPGHHRAVGIPILAGRGLADIDNRADADPVVVVDEVLARALWPGEDPIGRRISGFGPADTWYTVVGVAAATRYRELLEPHPRAYYPLRRLGNSPPSAFLVRTTAGAAGTVDDRIREAFGRTDPQVRVMSARPMSEVLRRPTLGRRFAANVLMSFAAATLLLAAIGVYGVFTVWVQERRKELGIRRAMGAQRSEIVALVLRRTLEVAALGAAIGLLVAVFAGRLVETLLYGVAPADVITLSVVVGVSLILAVAAGLGPALRASATDPVVSLRID